MVREYVREYTYMVLFGGTIPIAYFPDPMAYGTPCSEPPLWPAVLCEELIAGCNGRIIRAKNDDG